MGLTLHGNGVKWSDLAGFADFSIQHLKALVFHWLHRVRKHFTPVSETVS